MLCMLQDFHLRIKRSVIIGDKMNQKQILRQSLRDIQQDFEELLYLYQSITLNLLEFMKEIKKNKKNIKPDSYDFLLSTGYLLEKKCVRDTKELKNLQKNEFKILSKDSIDKLEGVKESFYSTYRNLVSVCSGLIVASDFQSPSFLHSTNSYAGRQTGKIIGNINDYKRDWHIDGQWWEKQFLKEYIEGFLKHSLCVYLTSCGMAAFTTLINYLLMDKTLKGPILIGKSIYFENKEVIKKLLIREVLEVDESNTREIKQIIAKQKPSVVVFDSLCNSYGVDVVNLPEIINFLQKHAEEKTFLLIDNTCLPVFFQPIKKFLFKNTKVKLLVFESLNKYYQFGTDRITGGVFYTSLPDSNRELFFLREHLGTNIGDASVYALPRPSKKMLKKRLLRLDRNTRLVAFAIQRHIKKFKNGPYLRVAYPGLSSHKSYEWTKNMPFLGCFFVIQLKLPYQKIRTYRRFVNIVMDEAKKQKVDITSGTSFGLERTRIYVTASNTDYGKPFLRVAVGTENRLQIEKLMNVFKVSMDRFVKPFYF